jgi:NAD(P)-dependent dehydrogenase (short-subunit alcohol dehydrogenase family)
MSSAAERRVTDADAPETLIRCSEESHETRRISGRQGRRGDGRVGGASAVPPSASSRRGADVGLIARGRDRLEAAAEEVRSAGRRACVAPADVADAEQVEAAAARIEAELGPIDVWVNCAMTAVLAEVTETTPDEFARVLNTHRGLLAAGLAVAGAAAFAAATRRRPA